VPDRAGDGIPPLIGHRHIPFISLVGRQPGPRNRAQVARGRQVRRQRDERGRGAGAGRLQVVREVELAGLVGKVFARHRRKALGNHDVIAGGELQQPQEPVAAIGPALVILHQGPDGMAIVGILAPALAGDMAAQKQEQVGVAFERVIDGVRLGAPNHRRLGIAKVVRHDDGAPVGVGGQHLVSPGQQFRGRIGVILEIQHQEVQPADAEDIVVVIIVRPIVPRVVFAPGKMRHAEILVVVGGGAHIRCSHRAARRPADRRQLVVAHRHAVGDAIGQLGAHRVLQAVHGVGRVIPLFNVGRGVAIVRNIPELGHVGDIARKTIADGPFGLGNHHLFLSAGQFSRVHLGIRHDRNAEIRPGMHRGRLPPIERHRQVAGQGIGHPRLQVRRGADVRA